MFLCIWKTEGSEIKNVVNKKLNRKRFSGKPRQKQQDGMSKDLITIDKTNGE